VGLLAEKLSLLEEVLRITREADLLVTDDTDEDQMRRACDEYVALYEKRAEMFINIENLDKELEKAGLDKTNPEIAACAEEIYSLDSHYAMIAGKLSEFIKKGVKEISAAKLVCKYMDDGSY